MNVLCISMAALLGLGSLPASSSLTPVVPQAPTPAPPAAPAQERIPECKVMTKTASGLEWGVLQKGRDEPGPGPEDVVEVHYTGWLLDGTEFDGSRGADRPAEFAANGVIKGWTEGLQLMTPGARHKLVIPADLAYGAQGYPPKIGPNTTLVFEVELLKVTRMPKLRPANKDAQVKDENGIKWEVVKAGAGPTVPPNEGVSLRYAVWNAEGALMECTERNKGKLLSGVLSQIPPFLKDMVVRWKVGEIQRLEVPQSVLPGAISDTVWELEVISINKIPEFRAADAQKVVTTQSGLQYEVLELGTGESPKAADTVLAHYTGWLTDGTLFDSSHARGEPTQFPLRGVIKGWTEGVQLMKVGGKFLFTIPGDLAYGARGRPPVIPANATLVFFIELVEIKK